MDPARRKELEDVTRDGLVKIGATPEKVAWVLEPGIPDEEFARRAKQAIDDTIHARVGAAIIDHVLADPAMKAELEAAVEAELAKKRRQKLLIGAVVGVAVIGIVGFAIHRITAKSPCAKMLGTDADVTAAFGQPARLGKDYKSKYFCNIAVEDPTSGNRLAWIEIESASRWAGFEREVSSKDFASVEPANVGDVSKLAIAGPRKEVSTDVASLLARRRAGSRDPMGDALAAMGPAGHTLVAKAGDGALHVIFYGSPEQARTVTKWLAPRIDPLRSSGYR